MNTIHKKARMHLKQSRDWFQYRRLLNSIPKLAHTKLGDGHLLITGDDVGSVGDAAMVRAVCDHFTPEQIDVSRWNKQTTTRYPGTGNYIEVNELKGAKSEALLAQYKALGCLGADVMDGLYSYVDSSFRLRLLGLAANMGLDARLYGFSFNASPHPVVAKEFKNLHPRVKVFVRDPVSLQRLKQVVDRDLVQVADLAFLVHPTENNSATKLAVNWIETQRTLGQQVLGINLHPMFSFEHGSGITEGMLSALNHALSNNPGKSYVLIPHDYRHTFGDVSTLTALHASLAAMHGKRILLLDGVDDPAEIKGLVGHLDGVLTGRMHLAIAALGQGVPVAAITYQGKFEGLLQHFHLSQPCTIAPPDVADRSALNRFLEAWVAGLDVARKEVSLRLPMVRALAELNFS